MRIRLAIKDKSVKERINALLEDPDSIRAMHGNKFNAEIVKIFLTE